MTIAELADRYGDDDEEREALLAATKRRLDTWRRRDGKFCRRCQVTKPVADFGPDARTEDGLRSACRRCETHGRHSRL